MMDTKRFNDKHASKSRRVCERIEREDAERRGKLGERERQIIDMWPRFEDGEPVWFGDEYACDDGSDYGVYQIEFDDGFFTLIDNLEVRETFLTGERLKRPAPADSWEKLEEDAAKEPCDYFGVECDEDKGCSGCPHLHKVRDCTIDMQTDLIRRAKALAGAEVSE